MSGGKRTGFKNYNPLKEIDWNRVDTLLEAGCTAYEIAADQCVSISAFYNNCLSQKGIKWSDYKTIKRDCGKGSLRLAQHSKALNGSDTMLKWLGEHRLGQTPKAGQNVGIGKVSITVKHFVVDPEGTQQEVLKQDVVRTPDVADAPETEIDKNSFDAEKELDRLYELDETHCVEKADAAPALSIADSDTSIYREHKDSTGGYVS